MIRPAASAAVALAVVLATPGCSRSPPGSPPSPPAGASALAPPTAAPTAAYVSAATILRREASDASRVKGPGGKDVSNHLATLQRGEKITVLESREEWARVRASDDQEGWLRRGAVLEGEGIVEATVLAPADVFDRPDLLAANARRKIDPGTLLLVVKARPPFSEVSVSSGPNAWVLTDRLATGETDVSVAKLAEKARWLKRNGKEEEAKQIAAFARQTFPGPLSEALAIELGEAPPPAAEPPVGAPAFPDR